MHIIKCKKCGKEFGYNIGGLFILEEKIGKKQSVLSVGR